MTVPQAIPSVPLIPKPVKAHHHLAKAISPRGLRADLKKVDGFNAKLAITVTKLVGTVWCAYTFACIALIGLPPALGLTLIPVRFATVVLWVSSEFLQLVLLSVLMVGQSVQGAASDARAVSTYEDTVRIIDALDCRTEGGLKTVLDAVNALAAPTSRKLARPKTKQKETP